MNFGTVIDWVERGWVPDALIRPGIRRIVRERLQEPNSEASKTALFEELKQGPVALHTDLANDQHYEVPAEFFQLSLGPRLKYSCAYYADKQKTLGEAEEAMLSLYSERAQLANAKRILELGCGWGSLTLWMAEKHPQAEITAVSNSASQKAFIDAQCAERGFTNVTVITADMVDFDPTNEGLELGWDRVISIEMFEHMHNYHELLRRIRSWMRAGGLLFVHIFCHQQRCYKYETDGSKNWMAQHFFTGGTMPSFDMLSRFNEHLTVTDSWWVGGEHYGRTANDWLQRMDSNRARIQSLFEKCYGPEQAKRWIQRWRLFHLAVEEMFAYDQGREWGVGHFLLKP